MAGIRSPVAQRAALGGVPPGADRRVGKARQRHPLVHLCGGLSPYHFPAFVLGAVAQQVLLSWAYNATGVSLPAIVLMHNATNWTLALNAALGLVPLAPFLVLCTACLDVAAVAAIAITRGRLGYGAELEAAAARTVPAPRGSVTTEAAARSPSQISCGTRCEPGRMPLAP